MFTEFSFIRIIEQDIFLNTLIWKVPHFFMEYITVSVAGIRCIHMRYIYIKHTTIFPHYLLHDLVLISMLCIQIKV